MNFKPIKPLLKNKFINVCENKDCPLKKYTKGDNRTIEEKYGKKILIFIRKQFTKKHMSFQYNPEIIRKHRPNLKGKINRNFRSYSFKVIFEMKITITATTGKGEASTEKDIDRTVEKLERIMELMDKDFGHYKWTDAKAMSDGTSMTLESK